MLATVLSPRTWLAAALLAGLATLVTISPPAGAEESSRQQEIAEIERQIQELTKKLEQLRQKPTPPPSPSGELPAEWVKGLSWRCIGPAAMGGRIVAISVYEADPGTYWVATASGGLLKTVNNGITFEHQFDREATVSIGDVCVAPSDRNVVWVGTGENNPRNSVSWGDGVYKSTDGGKTWKNMGLKKSFQIGKIIIHPKDPNTVFVGALGRLYGPSEERGLYKTTDGGQSWKKVLNIDERTGIIDMRMHPTEPDTLLAAAWERRRDEFDTHTGEPPPADGYDAYDPIKKWGPGGGIFKSTDGGKTWKKLKKGLPSCATGRIGLDYYLKDPKVVFAIIDTEKIGMGVAPSQAFLGIQGTDAPGGARLTDITSESPAGKAGLKAGDVIKAVEHKEVKGYGGLVQMLREKKPGDKLVLTVQRDKESLEINVVLGKRPEEGPPPARPLPGFRGETAKDGVVVKEVSNREVQQAGLEVGDILRIVDKKPVTSFNQVTEIYQAHKPEDKLAVRVQRGKETKDLMLPVVSRPGSQGRTPTRPWSFWYSGQRENVQDRQGRDGQEYGGVYRSDDGGETWTRINSVNPRPMYFSQVRVDPQDDKHLYVLGIYLYRSRDGGKTFALQGGSIHPDQHALWIDPRDGRHMIIGCDGGFYVTYDRMEHWLHLNQAAIGQFYHVALDSRRPYRVYGGLQDNGSWGGPSHVLDGRGPINEDWVEVGGGDGFVCRVDPNDPDLVYCEYQDGHMARRNLRTGAVSGIRPANPRGEPPYRFNWNTPFILSSHNSHIFYCGGNYVFRSLKQGDDLQAISQEITRTKRGTATAIAESPRSPNILWAGTDDGYLWVGQVSKDGGVKWSNVTDKVGLPGPRWVASIEPSHQVEGRAYVVFDGHRSDDDAPYVYVTEDFGQTWKSLAANLPSGSTRVLREDIENPNVLYLGTEFGVWVSLNRGGHWTRINNNLPTVAIHELAQHPTAGEMVAATHGRSLWVLDVTPLRQSKPATLEEKAHLYRPMPAIHWRSEPTRGSSFDGGRFVGENPQRGAHLCYSLAQKASKVQIQVLDYAGKTVRVLPGKAEPGLHCLRWDLVTQGVRFGRGRPALKPAEPGMYRIVLKVDDKEYTESLRVEPDPTVPSASLVAEEDGEEDEREMEAGSRWID